MKAVLFSNPGNGGGREDWDFCISSIAEGLIEEGAQTYLLFDDIDPQYIINDLNHHFLAFNLKSIIKTRVSKQIALKYTTKLFISIKKIYPILQTRNKLFDCIRKTLRFLTWLKVNDINCIVSINYWDSYAFIVCACECLGIPAISIQHGDYYTIDRLNVSTSLGPIENTSHEWPCTDVFLFSEKSCNMYASTYPSAPEHLHVTGWFPGLKWLKASPVRLNKIIIYESANYPLINELIAELGMLIGSDTILFRPHPMRQTHPHIFKEYVMPDSANADSICKELPELGISIGSSVSLELMGFKIPVLELLPSLPKQAMNYQFEYSNYSGLARFSCYILQDDAAKKNLIEEQWQSLPDYVKDSPKNIRKRIIDRILMLASH